MGSDCSWVRGFFWGDENVLKLDYIGSRTVLNTWKTNKLHTLWGRILWTVTVKLLKT